jgi:O-antigen/teichoic acid export membrane protein
MENVRRIASNAASMLTSNVISRAMSFVTYTLVARFLGASQFGQLSVAVALFSIFQLFAIAGLVTFTTREVAKDHSNTDRYFVNASIVVLFTSVLSTGVMFAIVRILNYAPDTSLVILLLSLGLVPYALSQIAEAVLIGWEKMHFIAYANVPSNVGQVAVVFVLLTNGFDVRFVAITMAVVYLVILLIDWYLLTRAIGIPRAKFELPFAIEITKTASTFLGIQSLLAVRSNIAILILSKFVTEAEVGFYNAAAQLTVPLRLIFDNFVTSIFPVMVRRFEAGQEALKRIVHNVIELLMAIALPGVIGILLLARPVIDLIYGTEGFAQSATLLQIMIWNPILIAFTAVIGDSLWASGREKVTLRIAIIDMVVKVLLSVILISQFGLIGAALTVLLEQIVNAVLHYLSATQMLSLKSLAGVLWKPVLASAVMAVLLISVQTQALYISIPLGAAVYISIMAGISILAAGGVSQLKRKYVQLWSE